MNPKFIKYAEWTIAILLSAAVLFLLVVRTTHAGALWRDEAATVQLAELPTLKEVATNFQHEAFPLPFPMLMRSYIGLFGGSDASLRSFGFIVGVLVLAVAWFTSRALGNPGPIVFLALFGLNGNFVIWETSVRGYGLGSALLLLTLGLSAKAMCDSTSRNALAATLAATLSTQIVLNSLPLVAAMAAAAFFVFLLERKSREAALVCICAAVPVLSFLPYLKSYLGADWTIVLKLPVTVSSLFEKFQQALAGDNLIFAFIWYAAVTFLLSSAIWILWRDGAFRPFAELRSVRFVLAFIVFSIVAYYAFLKILSYSPRQWYYLPWICLGVGAIEMASSLSRRTLWLRIGRIAIAVIFLFLSPLTWTQLRQPFTNINLIAQKLEAEAAPNDLIVLNPWHFAPSFYRYYHGHTPWITVPTMSEHRIHRYDLMKSKMMELEPLDDLREAIRQTLQSYHRVWIVGGAQPPSEDVPAYLGPAPNPYFGWAGYIPVWSIELGTFLNDHAIGDVIIEPPKNGIGTENIPLILARGWKN